MGQQQLLLIILGVIVVGVAVSVGLTMFEDHAIMANRDGVTSDLVNFASRAQMYYRRPASLAGGGNSFVGLTADVPGLAKLTSKSTNANGSYSIITAGTSTSVVLKGIGTEKGTNGTVIDVRMSVFSDSMYVNQLN